MLGTVMQLNTALYRGTSAIRMAAEEINAKQLIPGAYITLVERDSFPKQVQGQEGITQAVFAAVSLIQEGVIGVIGDISSSWTSLSALMTSTLRIPQCSFSAAASKCCPLQSTYTINSCLLHSFTIRQDTIQLLFSHCSNQAVVC